MFTKSNLAKEIIEYRQSNGLTQKELAKKADVSVRTIQYIESKRNTSLETIMKLLKAIDRQAIIIKV